MWEYVATVKRIVDGDTLDLRIDLGFTASVDVRVRLYGIDTPEVYGVKKGSAEYLKGKEASKFVEEWLSDGVTLQYSQVWVRSYDGNRLGQGKYGRWLADIYRNGDEVSLNDALVASGYAVKKSY